MPVCSIAEKHSCMLVLRCANSFSSEEAELLVVWTKRQDAGFILQIQAGQQHKQCSGLCYSMVGGWLQILKRGRAAIHYAAQSIVRSR